MRSLGEFRRTATFIEVLIVLVILMIGASWVLRVVYARQIHDWEDGVWHSLGIAPELGRLAVVLTFLVLLVTRAVLRRRRRWRKYGG